MVILLIKSSGCSLIGDQIIIDWNRLTGCQSPNSPMESIQQQYQVDDLDLSVTCTAAVLQRIWRHMVILVTVSMLAVSTDCFYWLFCWLLLKVTTDYLYWLLLLNVATDCLCSLFCRLFLFTVCTDECFCSLCLLTVSTDCFTDCFCWLCTSTDCFCILSVLTGVPHADHRYNNLTIRNIHLFIYSVLTCHVSEDLGVSTDWLMEHWFNILQMVSNFIIAHVHQHPSTWKSKFISYCSMFQPLF